MNICFISLRYPGVHNTTDFAFVKQLVDAIATTGHDCFVLSPFNINHYRKFSKTIEEYVVGKGKVTVFRPWYFSFSNWHIGKFYPSSWFFNMAMKRAFRKLPIEPDIIYGHFWDSAYQGYKYAKKRGIPLFVATGESDIRQLFPKKNDEKEFGEYVRGVICVSSKNRDESIKLGLTTIDKCEVFPNAVNVSLFHKRDKLECRKRLGLPQNGFIVAFVGWFNERKGVLRVAEAINKVGNVYSIFIGKGDHDPNCEGVLFKGEVPHEQVPFYLCASDCFVLPTFHEGCCNAVVEALSCGLPVVSSNLPFNWDVLDSTNSIMVNPNNIEEIANAIRLLRDDSEKFQVLSENASIKAQNLTIDQRSKAIMNFINCKINNIMV